VDLPIIPAPVRRWECQHCNYHCVTHEPRPHSQMHPCGGFGGLTMPMVLEGSGARTRLVEREDYVGREDVQLVDGRPVMSAITDHPDGRNDLVVFAPTATSSAKA
jgi:hypothetical protein